MEEEIIEAESECEDNTEALLKKYDDRRSQKIEDIIAMQTMMCLIAGAILLGVHLLYPEIFVPVFSKVRRLISDENEIMPNLIDYAEKLWK